MLDLRLSGTLNDNMENANIKNFKSQLTSVILYNKIFIKKFRKFPKNRKNPYKRTPEDATETNVNTLRVI